MEHQRVKGGNLFSVGHDGDSTMEARFNCSSCNGGGTVAQQVGQTFKMVECPKCEGTGGGLTYTYTGPTAEEFTKVLEGDELKDTDRRSIGSAFHRIVKAKYNGVKQA